MNISELESNFKNPPKNYSPFVRWWWFGCNITPEELEYELEEISKKGFGGVEIQSIYAPFKRDKKPEDEIIKFLSPKWLNLVEFAVNKSKELNITVDMTFGNGWPFGGPYIPKEKASSKLESFTIRTIGKKIITRGISKYLSRPEDIVALIAIPKKKDNNNSTLDNKDFIDIMPFLKRGKIEWKIPRGKWIIKGYFNGKTNQMVKRAAPGGEGFVLDHLDRDAFKIHSDNFGGKLIEKFGADLGKSFNAFFCDSWEVYHENWTRNFISKFKELKGYNLTPYLPTLAITHHLQKLRQKITNNEEIIRYNYDYKDVHASLIKEEFFKQFVDYCHSVNVKARVQPYVAPTDLLYIYGLLDILEIEGFGKHGIGSTYYGGVDPRLASSGAHIYQKNTVSCESFTWLGEHFSVSLEHLKREADQIILHGINYIIYHGYPYSPRNEGNPGWVFYASILANHNNTWWPYIADLNLFLTRCSYISRNSINVADWAIYLPYHDEWSDKPGILKKLRLALRENGHFTDFDYVNDERLLNDAKLRNNRLLIGNGDYLGLILWNIEYLPLKTALKLVQLADQGLNLILIGNIPHNAPGMNALQQGDCEKVKELFEGIKFKATSSNPSSTNLFWYNSLKELDLFYKVKSIQPDFIVKFPNNKKVPIKYLHQRIIDADLYFIVNESGEYIEFEADLREKGFLELWDPIDGSICSLINDYPIKMALNKYESKWLIVRRDERKINTIPQISRKKDDLESIFKEIHLVQGWNIIFQWPDNAFPVQKSGQFIIENSNLFDWTSKKQTRYFSGTAIYEIKISLLEEDIRLSSSILLDLGKFHEIASISVNGTFIQNLWVTDKKIDLIHYVKSGQNHLEIKITNLLLNKIIGYARNRIKWRRDYYLVNQQYLPFKPRIMKLLSSGLLGPVKIKFIKELKK